MRENSAANSTRGGFRDDAIVSRLVARGLDVPVKITEASSGFDALRELPCEDFDLVVADISTPDINGLEPVSSVRGNGFRTRTAPPGKE